jgi:hypothetical protein
VIKEISGVFHDDPKMSSHDLEQIEILSEGACSKKWIEYVSAVNRHFMQLHDDEWPAKVVDENNFMYHWQEDWNNDDFPNFRSHLQSVGLPEESVLYIFWMKEVGIKTTWGIFCNNWGNFLYEDEGCILVLPEHSKSIVLSNGQSWLGDRSA